MARYTGPRAKIARRFGEPIFGTSKSASRRPFPPGQHGKGRRRKQSEYAVQLAEKQKVKYAYGVLERQFRNLYDKASRKPGIKGENLLKFLEARLDNVVYRLGIAPTRRAARQLVLHKHIVVGGDHVVNIPSYSVRPGETIGVREKSKSLEAVEISLHARAGSRSRYPWLTWDGDNLVGTFVNYPERTDIPENINEQLIVELYSK